MIKILSIGAIVMFFVLLGFFLNKINNVSIINNRVKRKLTYDDKYWAFTREVLLEIKKQKLNPLRSYPANDGIAYNVDLLLDKKQPIPIEEFGKY